MTRHATRAARIHTRMFDVEVNSDTGAFALIDKVTGQQWGADPWVGTAGILSLETPYGQKREFLLSRASEIRVETLGDSAIDIAFARLVAESGEVVDATVKARLAVADDEGGVRVEVLAIDPPNAWSFAELEYPCRLGALRTDVDEGYMVAPYLQGSIVPSTVRNWKEIPKLSPWSWDDGPWMEPGGADLRIGGWLSASLPMFGAVKGASAFMGIVETENDASLRFVLNSNYQHVFSRAGRLSPYSRIAVCSPLWLAERGKLGYPRSILYLSLPGGDYVAMAKRYRQFARGQGLLVTLPEKIERTPALRQIIGGPWVHLEGGYPYYIDHPLYRYTWNDARKFVDDLRDYVGLKRALLTLWIGYQHLPPDFYPFHSAQGPIEDLRSLIEYAKTRDVLINFYHGYPALLDDAPNGDVARARKLNAQGWMGQRWGRNCPAFFLEHARKNLPPAVRDSGMVCDYTDILTACTLNECWDERHPLTRTEDRRLREETMRFIASLGLFSGSEWPVPYAMPHLAYFRNGGAGAGSHLILSQVPVPLFNLVFKDCAIMYGQFFPVADAAMMRDLAAGCHLQATLFSLKIYYTPGYFRTREGIRLNVDMFQDWNRATGLEELTSHEFLEEWNGPYRTRFSDGSVALMNLTTEIREVEGQTLMPDSIHLHFADGRKIKATPRAGWELEKS
ncbi:MAG: DUF5696 domain-containing protein [Candidatus Sumerlaeota bacterium]|nr:DUF5696 domain-containing protein [Candidatus Sumerlaeota bacterium]